MPITREQAEAYIQKRSLDAYLRRGTSAFDTALALSRTSELYVWRTTGDDRVRPSHRKNEGKIFRRDTPPPTGHPGDDYNCRCRAEPYVPGKTEYANHTLLVAADLVEPWNLLDFVQHYYLGGGSPKNLRDIGHLQAISEHYAYKVEGTGALYRLTNQIAEVARIDKWKPLLYYDGRRPYRFHDVSFAHGSAVVDFQFYGLARISGPMLRINGIFVFRFSDDFTDPASIRELTGDDLQSGVFAATEIFGTAYKLSDTWSSTFEANVLIDRSKSIYYWPR